MGIYYAGLRLTPIDMSPNYAGFLTAISNGLGSLAGITAPYLAGWMTPNVSSINILYKFFYKIESVHCRDPLILSKA